MNKLEKLQTTLSRLVRLSPLVLLALVVLTPGAAAQAVGSGADDASSESSSVELSTGGKAVPDRVIVKFKEDTPPADEDDALLEEGLEKEEDLDLIDAEVVKTGEKAVEQAVSDLENRPDVEYAEPDYIRRPHGYADEPRFGEQWGLNNTGQTVANVTGVADFDINGLEASSTNQGDPNVVVAVIDDGVDFSHPDLAGREWTNPGESGGGKEANRIDDDGNGYVDDVNGWDFANDDNTIYEPTSTDYHATHVSGVIAASANGQGVVGVAPNIKIMSLKFLNNLNGTISDEIAAIQYATRMGARVINASYGDSALSQAEKDAIEVSGRLFVASAGNSAANNDGPAKANYPSSYDSANVLSVAAVDSRGNLAGTSNYGATSVDISAPGVNILGPNPGNAYYYRTGTSFAAPHATGTAALVASTNPALLGDPAALKKRVMDTSKPVPSTAGKTVTGGMVDAQAASDFAAPNPPVITSPATGSTDADGSFTISGTAAANSTIAVFEGATSKGTTTANGSGNWSLNLTGVAEGSHTYTATATDAVGNTSAASGAVTITVEPPDTTAPTGSVSINDDANKTRKRKVRLTLEASDPEPGSAGGVREMRFSKNNGQTWTNWQPYATSAPFKIGKRAGKQKVYVQFRDSAGNKSSTFQDSIKYAPR